MTDAADLDVQGCARILLTSSRDWQAADGRPATLANVRAALARLIYALGGEGFPEAASNTVVRSNPEIWSACFAAAQEARAADGKPLPPEGRYAVLWSPDPDADGKLASGLPINWPYQPTSHVARIFGPVIDGDNRPKHLFMFDAVDENAGIDVDIRPAPGLWPKPVAPVPAASALPTGDVITAAMPSQRRLGMATIMFGIWVVSCLYVGAWQWIQGDIATRSWAAFQRTVAAAPDGDDLRKCTQLNAEKKLTWLPACDRAWNAARAEQKLNDSTKSNSIYDTVYRHFWTDAQSSLLRPFIWTLVATCFLIVACGLGSERGVWFGALIDPRTNRFSLSRMQQTTWTTVLLGALFVTSGLNAILVPSTLDASLEFIPAMAGALWAALGINLVASPYLSALIRDAKDPPRVGQKAADPSLVKSLVTPATLNSNESPKQASWLDLVTGETEGTEKDVDISRLQHLIISGLLIAVYLLQLGKLLRSVSAEMIATAFVSNKMPFTDLPYVGETFLGLLLLSHGGYLVFKARQSNDAASASQTPK
uniref:hypothetical protein n=1 Tax=Bradyrhizobium sp. (strain ORS 278) TaxID=114615 RepID=UPI0002FAAB19|nr:hypothetical protein [Bradyrhizobium sp. ORS 278]